MQSVNGGMYGQQPVVCDGSMVLKIFLLMQGGFKGFYARNTLTLDPKVVNDIHKRGGTILGTSRGGHDTMKIVDSIENRGINQVNHFDLYSNVDDLAV